MLVIFTTVLFRQFWVQVESTEKWLFLCQVRWNGVDSMDSRWKIWSPPRVHLESIWNKTIIWQGCQPKKFHLESMGECKVLLFMKLCKHWAQNRRKQINKMILQFSVVNFRWRSLYIHFLAFRSMRLSFRHYGSPTEKYKSSESGEALTDHLFHHQLSSCQIF